MNERSFYKLMSPLARRLQNLVARGTVVLSDASKKMQALQVSLLADEVADGVEHFEAYGLTARPKPGAEHVTIFVDGDRSHPLTIVVADRRYRLKGLLEGEVAIYDDLGQKVHLTRTGIVVDGGGKPITLQNAGGINFNGVGSIKHDGVNIGKTHTHGNVGTGTGTSGIPNN